MKAHKLNPHYAAVVFCLRCGSNRIDVKEWTDPTTSVIRCGSCGHECSVDGLTVGRAMGERVSSVLRDAAQDQASPDVAGATGIKGVRGRAS